jgi:hypothetical protein
MDVAFITRITTDANNFDLNTERLTEEDTLGFPPCPSDAFLVVKYV